MSSTIAPCCDLSRGFLQFLSDATRSSATKRRRAHAVHSNCAQQQTADDRRRRDSRSHRRQGWVSQGFRCIRFLIKFFHSAQITEKTVKKVLVNSFWDFINTLMRECSSSADWTMLCNKKTCQDWLFTLITPTDSDKNRAVCFTRELFVFCSDSQLQTWTSNAAKSLFCSIWDWKLGDVTGQRILQMHAGLPLFLVCSPRLTAPRKVLIYVSTHVNGCRGLFSAPDRFAAVTNATRGSDSATSKSSVCVCVSDDINCET